MAEVKISVADARNLIPDFDGNAHQLDRFIGCCDILFESAKGNAEQLLFLNILKTRLTGPAYEVLKYHEFKDWKTLKSTLKQQFQDDRPRVAVQAELLRLKQKSSENIGAFAHRLNTVLAELNNVTCNNELDAVSKTYLLKENELNAIRAFEDGLRNEQLRVIVKSKGETNLRKLINYASEHALRLETQTKLNEFNKGLQICEICGKRGHSKSTCFRNKLIPSFHPPGPQVKKEAHRVICSYCQKPNHIRNECRTRLRDERTKRQGQYTNAQYPQRSPAAPFSHPPTSARQVRWNTISSNNSENEITRMEYNGGSTRVAEAVIHQEPEVCQSEYP